MKDAVDINFEEDPEAKVSQSESKDFIMMSDSTEVFVVEPTVESESSEDIKPKQETSQQKIKGHIERIEILEQKKAYLADDIRAIYGVLKSNGFDPKVVRDVIKARKLEEDVVQEQMELFDVYYCAAKSKVYDGRA